MTDLATSFENAPMRRIDTESPEAKARIRKRYRSERRFRTYGIVALLVSALFLLALIFDILRNGIPAFWQHSFVADVTLSPELLGLQSEPTPEALRAADYTAVARSALAKALSGISGRRAKKDLRGLLSSGATDTLRRELIANPTLVGQAVKTKLLLSDNADLYLKGNDTRILARTDTKGSATPSNTTGDVSILSSSADFTEELAEVKKHLKREAGELRARAERIKQRAGPDGSSHVAELMAEAKALEERSADTGSTEALTDKMPSRLIAMNGGIIKLTKMSPTEVSGNVLIPLSSADKAKPGDWKVLTYETPEAYRNLSDRPIAFLEQLKEKGAIERHFNWVFFSSGDSREPELAGIRGALMGSFLTLTVTLVLCLPIGVMAAIYLEEFAPKNRMTDIIEININNLAAVPSIVFGLLGLAVFLNVFGMPRSAPVVGGLVLALLVLPTIIIASRAALKAVPPSIKEAALGVGASKQQAIFHHVLPLAMPGIMTGSIIGMAHALGETAPLLMIGMIAFIVDVPQGFTEAATVLPVQIFLWSDLPEPAFQAKTAAAIIILLIFLFLMNGTAILLRKRFERRW